MSAPGQAGTGRHGDGVEVVAAATPASRQARSIVGTIASRWARLATSGTTPPNRACSSTLLAIGVDEQRLAAHDADTGLVAGRLDAEDERLVGGHQRAPSETCSRMTRASTSPGW